MTVSLNLERRIAVVRCYLLLCWTAQTRWHWVHCNEEIYISKYKQIKSKRSGGTDNAQGETNDNLKCVIILQGHLEMFQSTGSLYGNFIVLCFCVIFCLCCSSYVHFWKSAKNLVVWCLLYHSQQPLDRIHLKHTEKETYFSHSGLQSMLNCDFWTH